MKLNGTHQLLAYADDVNILGESILTLKENTQVLVAATRQSTYERLEEFKYLGTILTNKNSIAEEIKSRLSS